MPSIPISREKSFSSSKRNTIIPHNGYSQTNGPIDEPLSNLTLGQFFETLVRDHGTKPALVCRHESMFCNSVDYEGGLEEKEILRWDFNEFSKNIEACRRGLKNIGLVRGDRLAVFSGNNSKYATLQFASAKSGIILTCVNPAARMPELLAALNLSGVKALFITPTFKNNQHFETLKEFIPTLTSSKNHELNDSVCPTLKSIIIIDNTLLGKNKFDEMLNQAGFAGRDYRDILDFESKEVVEEELDSQSIVNLQFTSGTTGLPKAVALSHHNLLNNGRMVGDAMNLEIGKEVLINSPPLFHCFGLVLGNLAFWSRANCIVYPTETFEPLPALRAVYLEGATAIHGVPTMFLALLQQLDSNACSDIPEAQRVLKLRTGIAAGSPVSPALMSSLVDKLGLRDLVITYGMTETSPATVNSRPTDSLKNRCDTVGRVLPHTSIRIVDTNDELYPSEFTPTVPIGESGELWSAGYALQRGYWNNEKETVKTQFTDRDGVRWIKTGDRASMDSNGYISIVGRIKDQIARGGEKLSPIVIENRTLQLEGVFDVSVIGVPDRVMGEVVAMFVMREQSEQGKALTKKDIVNHIDRVLSSQAKPDWIWFMGEDLQALEWPKTASGKIRKIDLKEIAKPLLEMGIGKMRI